MRRCASPNFKIGSLQINTTPPHTRFPLIKTAGQTETTVCACLFVVSPGTSSDQRRCMFTVGAGQLQGRGTTYGGIYFQCWSTHFYQHHGIYSIIFENFPQDGTKSLQDVDAIKVTLEHLLCLRQGGVVIFGCRPWVTLGSLRGNNTHI